MKEHSVTSLAGLVGYYHGYVRAYKSDLEWINKDVKSRKLEIVIKGLEDLIKEGDDIFEAIQKQR